MKGANPMPTTRTKSFCIRLTEKELDQLNKKIKKTGMTREGYVRTLISGYEPVCIPPIEYFEIISQLRRLGNNMNQIAYRANALGILDESYYRETANRVMDLCDFLYDLQLPQKQERGKGFKE